MVLKSRQRSKKVTGKNVLDFDYILYNTDCNLWYNFGFFPSTGHCILKPQAYFKIYNDVMKCYPTYKQFDFIMDVL